VCACHGSGAVISLTKAGRLLTFLRAKHNEGQRDKNRCCKRLHGEQWFVRVPNPDRYFGNWDERGVSSAY